jgi:uncharacterized alpha/beta hydrolase family protein
VANWWKVATKNLQDKRTLHNFDNVGYGKYGNVSLGGYYIPDYNSFSSYVKELFIVED